MASGKALCLIPQESSEHRRSRELLASALLFLGVLGTHSEGRPVVVVLGGASSGWQRRLPNAVSPSEARRGAVERLCWHLNPVSFHTIRSIADCSASTLFNSTSCCDFWNAIQFEFLAVTSKTKLSKAVEPPSTAFETSKQCLSL